MVTLRVTYVQYQSVIPVRTMSKIGAEIYTSYAVYI